MTEQPILTTRLICRANEEVTDTMPVATGVAGIYSVRNPFKDTDNEDAAVVIPIDETRAILAVADGVGGQPGGAAAAQLILQSLIDSASVVRDSDIALRTAIMEGIEIANQQLLEKGIGSATTLVALEIDGSSVRPYHVGDSMILIVGQRGKVLLQTVPHSPVGYAIEAGLLDEQEAIHHEDRHVVSNVVGSQTMRIEVGPQITLKSYDTVLLASDGVFDNLHVAEVIDLVRKGPLEHISKHLADATRQRINGLVDEHPSKPDDTTFIVYRLCTQPGGTLASEPVEASIGQ